MMSKMKTDEYGRVHFSADELFDILYRGEIIDNLLSYGHEIHQYNELCRINDKTEFQLPDTPEMESDPVAYHQKRQATWALPVEYKELDIWKVLEGRCATDIELQRLREERLEYEKRDLVTLLRLMMYLVDDFRRRNIIWGIGRGSSVASFVLYLIGITKINPLLYGLEISEFLKD